MFFRELDLEGNTVHVLILALSDDEVEDLDLFLCEVDVLEGGR